MTRLIYSQETSQPANETPETIPASEAGQIMHLKRVLVTLKQHYEKSLHSLQIQLQVEQNQRIALQKELVNAQAQACESHKLHDEELQALRQQQTSLKELLKKTQEELKQANQQRAPHSHQEGSVKAKEDSAEVNVLRLELDRSQKKIHALEQDLATSQELAHREMGRLKTLLESQKDETSLETVISTTSSHHLKQELESIKRTLAQEAKSLESRYMEILSEKIGLDHQCKQLQHQLENQSSNLSSFQEQLHQMEKHKTRLEESLQTKENELSDAVNRIQELQAHLRDLEIRAKEKDFVQDKYEQLKDEWNQLGERLEEAADIRSQAEEQLNGMRAVQSKQEAHLAELTQQLQMMQEESKNLEGDRDQLKILLDESETRLKVAQQHLAKKVKESALLAERVEEQQHSLSEMTQALEQQKTQMVQLQASVDLYQRQEKRLQEQLHDALKGTESQVTKWEEKYFRMYDKWQESEHKILELKKFEEKHHQMQHFLANLGNFMGGPLVNPPLGSIPIKEELIDRQVPASPPEAMPVAENHGTLSAKHEENERYDLFGMRHPKTTPFS